MLEEMAVHDFLGPADGPDEELTERIVRDRYLVGVLAPRLAPPSPTPAKPAEDDDEEAPLIPDELAEDGSDTADDGTTDRDMPLPRASLPSSFGMSFCVDREATVLRVEARWGQYLREKKEDQADIRTGHPLRVWTRHPRGGATDIKLRGGPLKPFPVDPECPDVLVRGQIRKRDHGWIVTLFLVNGQAMLLTKKGRGPPVPAGLLCLSPGRVADLLQTVPPKAEGPRPGGRPDG